MIKGIFLFFNDTYICSNQVELKIILRKKNITRHTLITAYNCYGLCPPEIDQDVDCVIKYEVGPPMRFSANVKEFNADNTAVLQLTSELSKENVAQLISTIAKLK